MTTVAVALIERNSRILICQRRQDQSHPGKWEFPGGKAEQNEDPREALARELKEELGIDVIRAEERVSYEFQYPGKAPLRLVFFSVPAYEGHVDCSQFAADRWVARKALAAYDFLEGDERIVRELSEDRH